MHTQPPKQEVSPAPASQSDVNGATQNSIPEAPNAASIDDLISSASKQADEAAFAGQAAPQPAAKTEASGPEPASAATSAPVTASKDDAGEEKSAKKDKDKPKTTRLVYSDNETSPEEKMATLSRYAFTVEQRSVMA